MKTEYDLATKLRDTRAEIQRVRSQAFIDYLPLVAGVRLEPVTLRSYNRLVAFESPFVCGGSVDFTAIFVFCWCHYPSFGQFAEIERKRLMRAIWRRLNPRAPHLNLFLRFVAAFPGWQWVRRLCRATAEERFAEAVSEIRRLLAEALDDLPSNTADERDEPAPVAIQAQILNAFRRGLSLPYSEIEAMPLKRLVQLLRETLYHAAGKSSLALMHPREAAIWREHLDRAQARITADAHG